MKIIFQFEWFLGLPGLLLNYCRNKAHIADGFGIFNKAALLLVLKIHPSHIFFCENSVKYRLLLRAVQSIKLRF